jgi:hypothetical protein
MYSTLSAMSSWLGKRVEHSAVPHDDAVDGDRVELDAPTPAFSMTFLSC